MPGMKVKECFCFVLGFTISAVFYFAIQLSTTINLEKRYSTTHSWTRRGPLAEAQSSQLPLAVATPTPMPIEVLNKLMKDDCKLKAVLNVDGPLDVTIADLPVLKSKKSVRDTYMRPPTLVDSYTKPVCSNSLRSTTGPSEWFNERFNPRLKHFLDKNDINKWENFYNLSYCPALPLGLRNVQRRGLIRLVNNGNYSTSPIFSKESQTKCVRCAVVGTSGILKGSNAGAEIDSYDYVFRMNIARLRGFEKDVGNKTSFYFGFPQSLYLRDLNDFQDVYFIFPIFTHFMVSWLELFLNGTIATVPKLSLRNFNNGLLMNPKMIRILHPDFLRHFQINFLNGKGFYPSTGAITAAFALYNCDEIKMFGFGVAGGSTLHYYDKGDTARITTGRTNHNFLNEWNLWDLLEKNNIVSFFRPKGTEQANKTDT
ncbi:CMP-N-acetylneuraminate-beta-galactosamide-alpha-2,3-sialyltransferase 1-like [Ptychodera flava]|uniref:CMP-N-acetylneuraminate-beta-galactosamide- alpha-2,3-sialyltransferase 1-like n=1 Tax=Ptychodera flava TaxID=63121 RepID=UPI003969FB40